MKILWAVLTLLVCSSSFASGWTDDFDFGLSTDWVITPTDAGDPLDPTRNHTASDTNSPLTSLKLDNTASGVTTAERTFTSPFTPSPGGLYRFWFYDEGQPVVGFRLGAVVNFPGAAPLDPATTAVLSVGLQEAAGSASNQYIFAYDSYTTPTGIARSTGWHLVEMLTGFSGITVRIDGSTFPENSVSSATSFNSASFDVTPGATHIAANNRVWVDDVGLFGGENRFESNYDGNFSYNFETPPDAWDLPLPNPYIQGWQVVSGVNHTPDPESTNSMHIGSNPPLYGPAKRLIELGYEEPVPGLLTVWFHDDGLATAGYDIAVTGTSVTATGNIRGAEMVIGTNQHDPELAGFYMTIPPGQEESSIGIPRTAGWHKVEFGTTAEGTEIRFDGQPFPNNTWPGVTRLVGLELTQHNVPNGSETYSQFHADDISYQRGATLPPLSNVSNWNLY